MADTVYRVLTVYDAETKAAESSVGGLAIVLDHAINLAERARDMVSHVLSLGSELETTQIALAGLFSAGDFPGAKNFQTSMGMSAEIMKQMLKDARDLPGEFEDLKEIFQFAILGGSGAGKSVNQIEHMSAQLMSVTKALGMSSSIAGREFAELMEGRASSRIPLFAKLKNLMGDANMDAQKFNALSTPEKWERIERALASFGPMVNEYAKSWDAISTTAIDYVKNLFRFAGHDVFERLKQSLEDVNHWYERNQAAIYAIAGAIFGALWNAFQVIIGAGQAVIDTVADFVNWLGLGGASTDDWAARIETFGSVLGGAVVVIAGVKMATLAWEAAQWALNLAMSANPIGILVVAIGALVAMVIDAIAYWEELTNTIAKSFDVKPMRWAMKAAGIIPKGATDADIDDAMGGFDRATKNRQQDLDKMFGDHGVMAHIKDMLGFSNVAVAHDNIRNPKAVVDAMSMMSGVPWAMAGTPDYKALLDAQKRAVPHTPQMNVRVELVQHINDAEDPARVLRLTKEGVRQSLEHPVRTFISGIYR